MTVLQRDTEKDVVLPWGPAPGSDHDDLVIAEVRRGGPAGASAGDVTHTRADQLAWVTKDGQSYTHTTSAGTKRSLITNDPVTGQPLLLRAQGEGQALYIYDGAPGSPMSILGADADQEVEFDYDPFGVPLTEDGASEPQNPCSFGATASRTAPPAGSATASATTTPAPAPLPSKTPSTHTSTRSTATATPTSATTPSTTSIPLAS